MIDSVPRRSSDKVAHLVATLPHPPSGCGFDFHFDKLTQYVGVIFVTYLSVQNTTQVVKRLNTESSHPTKCCIECFFFQYFRQNNIK